jgi:hypothetical protein
VLEKRVLRRIFRLKRAGEDCIIRSFITCTLYQIIIIIIIIIMKSRRKRWTAHVTQMGEIRNAYSIFVGKLHPRKPINYGV